MFVVGRPGRARVAGPRGVPGDRPGRDPRPAREVGRRTAHRRRGRDRAWPRRSARRSAAAPDRSYCRSPRTSSTSRCPTTSRPTPPGRASRAPTRRRDPRRHRAPRLRPTPGHPGRRRRPARPDLDRADPLRRAPPGAGHRAPGAARTSSRTTIRCISAWPGFGAASSVRSGSTRPTRCSSSAPASTRRRRTATRSRAPGLRWAHVDLEPGALVGLHRARDRGRGRRQGLPQGRQRAAGRAGRARRRARRGAPGRQPRRIGRPGRRPRSSTPTPWDGPGVHPGRSITTLRAGPARRRDPDQRRRQLRGLGWAAASASGGPGTFLGPTSGAMGYGLPAAIAAALVHRDRPVVALVGDGGLAMTMAELETAVRVGARVIVVVFDNERYGTIRMWQERARHRRSASPPSSGRSTSRRSRGPAARAACGSSATPTSSRRCARRSSADRRDGHPAGARPGVASRSI